MKKIAETIRRATLIAASAGGLLVLATAVNVRPLGAEEIDSVVASVDGQPITSHDVKAMMSGGSSGGPVAGFAPGTAPNNDPAAALKLAIEEKMLEQESQKYAGKVDDAEVDRYIHNLELQNHLTDQQLRAQLQAQHISYDTFRAKIRKQVEAMTMIDREVRQKIVIPEAEIVSYYKDHPSEFTTTDEKFRLAQILIAVPADATPKQIADLRHKAEQVRNMALKKGTNFGSLALKYSDDDSKSKGGELGEFSPSNLNDAILAAIKTDKAGDISPVVQTKYGFHIVKVEQHQLPGLKPIALVHDQIRETLMTDKAKVAFQKWVSTDLIKQHYVETLQ
jgi:peptidyl-prolyl cis-trans isomerase SurA